MTMPNEFADWYRTAAVTPPAGLLEKRWAGVESYCKKATTEQVMMLARLFAMQNPAREDVPPGFVDAFRTGDDTFTDSQNLQELRVLAGAALRKMISERHAKAVIAALSIVCASFGSREQHSPHAGHIRAAEEALVRISKETRSRALPIPKQLNLSKERFVEIVPNAPFAAGQMPNIYEPLINSLTELGTALASANEHIRQLSANALVRQEELDILWWLQTSFSRQLSKSFSELGYVVGTLLFPTELAELTKVIPGPDSIAAVIAHALRQAGAPSSSELITIASATNSTDRKWRESISKNSNIAANTFLFPITLAIQKSLDTDGDHDWLPIYRKACDISIEHPFSQLQFAIQFYRERILLRAIAGNGN